MEDPNWTIEAELELELVRRVISQLSLADRLTDTSAEQEFLFEKFRLLVSQRDFLMKQTKITLGLKPLER